jgi:hypothetical protein
LRWRFHLSTGGEATTAVVMDRDHLDIPAIEPVYLELYESSPFSWGEGDVIIRVEPSSMW